MRCLLALFLALGVVAKDDTWETYKLEFGREFQSEEHETARYWIFKENLNEINTHNRDANTYQLAVNQFTDMTADEFRQTYLGRLSAPKSSIHNWENLPVHNEDKSEVLASSFDWVPKGAVTPVKNQGGCGSCWAFGTTGSIEGAWYLATGKLLSLSEQQFVDCSKQNAGCQGGLETYAFAYAKTAGVCSESSYPYKGRDGRCSSCTPVVPASGVTGYTRVSISQSALKSAITREPVSIGVDASAWSSYGGSVFTGSCGTSINHAVLGVGYGTSGGVDYWKIKNSWATSWGESGYIRLQYNKCGVLNDNVYVNVNGNSVLV